MTTLHDSIIRLQQENAQLRTLLVEALRAMKEVELILIKALDKDHKLDNIRTTHPKGLQNEPPC